jgi:predicted nucleotidyltransferase
MNTEELQQCWANLERRTQRRQAQLDVRFAQAQDDCRNIVGLIARKYKPSRIYQWGSLLDRAIFWEHSDIDLAVEGLAGAQAYFALLGDADQQTRFPIDIVELERVEPEFAESIRIRGIVVWERAESAS